MESGYKEKKNPHKPMGAFFKHNRQRHLSNNERSIQFNMWTFIRMLNICIQNGKFELCYGPMAAHYCL